MATWVVTTACMACLSACLVENSAQKSPAPDPATNQPPDAVDTPDASPSDPDPVDTTPPETTTPDPKPTEPKPPDTTEPKPEEPKPEEPKPTDPLLSSVHVALGIPKDADASDDYLLGQKYFVVSYNQHLNEPNWVSWRLVATDLGSAARQNTFRADDLLPPEFYRVDADDYKASGYDRGHMCPSADRTQSIEANAATFLMTNMQPQLHDLNGGPWAALENFERDLASKQGKQVQIIAGGIFDAQPKTIGPNIAVPRANYKVIVVQEPGAVATDVAATTQVYAVIMPNQNGIAKTNWKTYLVTVDEIERQTGYDLLDKVPSAVSAALEAKTAN